MAKRGRLRFIGFGLNKVQQEALGDLDDWAQDSLESEEALVGPVTEHKPRRYDFDSPLPYFPEIPDDVIFGGPPPEEYNPFGQAP